MMRRIDLDAGTTIILTEEQYAVTRAYTNLFWRGNLLRAVAELARKGQGNGATISVSVGLDPSDFRELPPDALPPKDAFPTTQSPP